MPPITPDQYATGATLDHQGERFRVRGSIRTESGDHYLAASTPEHPYCLLLPSSVIRENEGDEWSVVTRETLDEEARLADEAANAQTDPQTGDPADQTGGTDAPGATDPQAPSTTAQPGS